MRRFELPGATLALIGVLTGILAFTAGAARSGGSSSSSGTGRTFPPDPDHMVSFGDTTGSIPANGGIEELSSFTSAQRYFPYDSTTGTFHVPNNQWFVLCGLTVLSSSFNNFERHCQLIEIDSSGAQNILVEQQFIRFGDGTNEVDNSSVVSQISGTSGLGIPFSPGSRIALRNTHATSPTGPLYFTVVGYLVDL